MTKELTKVGAGAITTERESAPMILEGQQGMYDLVHKTIDVPPDLLYKMDGKRGGYLASLYDLISREMAIRYETATVLAQTETKVRVGVRCRYWNRFGKMVEDYEEYEIDCWLMYEKMRMGYEKAEWTEDSRGKKKKEIIEQADVQVVRDEAHPELPPKIVVKLSDKAEKELYDSYLTLRRNMLAKAITCCHRRLAQRAIGIKALTGVQTWKEGWDRDHTITFYAFLPANADPKYGLQAVRDVTGETEEPGTDKPPADVKHVTEEPQSAAAGQGEPNGGTEEKPEDNAPDVQCEHEGCKTKMGAGVAKAVKEQFGKVLCLKHRKAS